MRRIKLYPPIQNAFVLPDIQVSSATLFGALANSFVLLHGSNRFSEFMQYYDDGLLISCLFPALRIDELEIFFLPKPYISYHTQTPDKEDAGMNKKALKKLRWFSEGLMERLKTYLREEAGEIVHTLNLHDPDIMIIGGQFALLKSELQAELIHNNLEEVTLYRQSELPRVSVPRFGDQSDPFHQIEISFPKIDHRGKRIQLFLYYLEENAPQTPEWQAVQELFAEEGIGGKRNLGKGYFAKLKTEEVEWEPANRQQMLLSDVIPQKQELSAIRSYDILRDDGYITFGTASSFKKSPVWLIKSGAVLSQKITGRMVEAKIKQHTIYRYGLALGYPLNGG